MENSSEWLDEAVRQHESGQFEDAAPLYERVLRLDPGHAVALFHFGKLQLARHNTAAGVELLRQAAVQRPHDVEVHQSLGIAYKRLGEWGNAAHAFEQALAINPLHGASYFELADLSQTLGRTDAAVNLFLRSINLDPANTEAFRRLGELLYSRENWVGAENCFARVIDTGVLNDQPQALAQLLNKFGIALLRQEKLDLAASIFRQILEIDPTIAEMHSNLAYVHERQGRLDDALAAGRCVVELKPDYAEGHNNLGVAYRALHRLDDARESFAKACELRPDFALAHFNRGTVDLMQGDFASGWRGYEWRNLTLAAPIRRLPAPRWDGRPMPGHTLLVHTEQGYGDTILFARFLKKARERSEAQIILEGPAALLPLLWNIAGADRVLQAGMPLPHVDAEIPLPSLPAALGIELADLPLGVSYLRVPEASRSIWRERLPRLIANRAATDSEMLKVGFVWTGNPAQQQNPFRSCPLACFAALSAIPGITWYSLQKEADETHLSLAWSSDSRVASLGPLLHDFADTAAAIGELDLVISVDTSVAHLAGAMGIPTLTLLSHTPDWRWQLDRSDSAWYPTMRLFRQPTWGDWNSVFNQVEIELRQIVSERQALINRRTTAL